MKGNELVWRSLADAALRGRREWANLADLAHDAGVPVSTTHLAVQRLSEIGAVRPYGRGGLSGLNPEKIVTVLAASRRLPRDTLAKSTVAAVKAFLDDIDSTYALGGTDAAVAHLSGINAIADRGTRIVYMPTTTDTSELAAGNEVLLLAMDSRAQRQWVDGYSSLAQTYADLFALPGWQAEEFRRALYTKMFSMNDWERDAVNA